MIKSTNTPLHKCLHSNPALAGNRLSAAFASFALLLSTLVTAEAQSGSRPAPSTPSAPTQIDSAPPGSQDAQAPTASGVERGRTNWWVMIPPAPARETFEERLAYLDKLRSIGHAGSFIFREPGPDFGAISLGLFKSERDAESLKSQLEQKGITGIVIRPRPTLMPKE